MGQNVQQALRKSLQGPKSGKGTASGRYAGRVFRAVNAGGAEAITGELRVSLFL